MNENNDGRLSFDEATLFVLQQPDKVAFAALPVFGERSDDAEQRAEGVRVCIVETDGHGGYRLRFIAGPFFANVHGANEIIAAADIPERVKELRFLPSRFDEAWLDGQIQILVQKLAQASGLVLQQMPDYQSAAESESTVFPISFVDRRQ